MKKGSGGFRAGLIVSYLALVLAVAVLSGCHSDHDDPLPRYHTEIVSDVDFDGDIGLSLDGFYTVTSAADTGSVLAGVNPDTGEEYRGFLDFPLGGDDGVPTDAIIESATLEVYIIGMSDSLPSTVFPFLIDLVDFQPPYLIESDFDRVSQPPLLTRPIDFYPSDVGRYVIIDVTSLMSEAQAEGLPDLQLRFILDFTANSGLIEIDDTDIDTAPLLKVTYY